MGSRAARIEMGPDTKDDEQLGDEECSTAEQDCGGRQSPSSTSDEGDLRAARRLKPTKTSECLDEEFDALFNDLQNDKPAEIAPQEEDWMSLVENQRRPSKGNYADHIVEFQV